LNLIQIKDVNLKCDLTVGKHDAPKRIRLVVLGKSFVTNSFGLLGYFEMKIYITDCRNRLSINLTYRIQYSSRNSSCNRHPQDNKKAA
jgi:hypothetical protein